MYAAGQPESAITRVVSAFKDCLSDTEVLRTIDDFFGDLGFEFDPEAEERNRAQGVGQRRSRAAGYLETLNLSQDTGRDMLAAAVGTKLAEWDDKHGPSPDRLTRLHRTLKTAGFEWNGSDVVPRTPTKAAAATKPAAAAPVAQAEPVPDVPSVFISYAHEDQAVAQGLAHALLARGSRVWIDVEMIRIGDDLADRIGKAIESVDFLLAIISEESVKSRWCKRELGIAFDAAMKTDRVKVLPLRLGSVSLPPILRGLYSPRVDPANVEAMADKILADMKAHRGDDDYGTPAAKRPDPPPSDPTDTLPAAPTSPPKVDPEEPIRIIGIDEEGVTRPRNDGSAGSGLYVVPLRLNRKPSPMWAHFFPSAWNRPSSYTPMHRPGIARVSGDRIILDGTTIEEVERYHAATLRLVIPEVNRQVAAQEEDERLERERAEAQAKAQGNAVRDAAKRITFD